MMQCQQQNIESMLTQEVEYLDYRRPGIVKPRGQYQRDPELQAIALKLHSIRQLQPQPTLLQSPEDIQPQPIQKPPFALSLTITLQTHKIIAQLGTHQTFQHDALLLPYQTPALQYQPCLEHKEQLKADSQKISNLDSKPGELYLKAKKLLNYKFRAFVKVAKETVISDLAYGLDSLFKLIEENPKKLDITSIAILYSPELSTLSAMFDLLLSLKPNPLPNPLSIHLLLPTRALFSQFYELTS